MTGRDLSVVPDLSEESGTWSVVERIRLEHIARRFDAPFPSDCPFPVEYGFLSSGNPKGYNFRR